ncbi:uncharacterized protein LOC131886706 [Tigriopus californicus]|uniref:uncharacterized protein LOC131886706 n=1 Tax=Tigriopus californicus TaxID=6832 RepID=UPI0027D9E888|nr:uncharacterized protein LOC131886706 [Tigriopus californicus]
MAYESGQEQVLTGDIPAEDSEDNVVNRRRIALLGSVTRKVNEIEPLILDPSNLLIVEEDYRELTHRMEALRAEVQEEASRPELGEETCKQILDWYHAKSADFLATKRRISNWIDRTNHLVVQPSDSVSVAGSDRSRTSVVSNARSEARIRLVESQAKLEAQQKLDTDLRRIQEERWRIEKSSQEERERLNRLERDARAESEKKRISDISAKLDQFDAIDRNKEQELFGRGNEAHSVIRSSHQIDLLAEIALRSHLPKSEPEVFDGTDLTRFTSFMQAFDRLIACNTKSPSDLLYYLEKYTQDEPRELVRSCFHMNPTDGYQEARLLLKKEYGNEFQVANAFLQKIQKWSNIKNDDIAGLKKLSIFLRGCENYLKTVSGMNQLNSPSQIQDIIMKLPMKLRERWRNRAFYLLENKGFVEFKDLSDFVHLQASIASVPIFGDIKDPSPNQGRTNQNVGVKRSMSFASSTNFNSAFNENSVAT